MREDLVYTLYIGAEPQKVWDGLVSEEAVKAIFYGCELRTTFREGEPYQCRVRMAKKPSMCTAKF